MITNKDRCLKQLTHDRFIGKCRDPQISNEVKGKEHYAHSGIIEAARELSFQLDNLAEDDDDAMAASDVTSIEGLNGTVGNPSFWLLGIMEK